MIQTPDRFERLLVPDRITLHLITPRKTVELTVQCVASSTVIKIINTFIRSLQGNSVRQQASRPSLGEIFIAAQLTHVSSYDLWQLRSSLQKAGGIIERVRENYHLRRATLSSQRPAACAGCRYYYGQKHGQQLLICAMHPSGPLESECLDKQLG